MSDTQLRQRVIIRRLFIGCVLLLVLGGFLIYYRFSTQADWDSYQSSLEQEDSLRSQIDALTASNNQLLSEIEESNLKLVSFTDDKIKYINLAAQLSEDYSVTIDKLDVSDVWQDGEISGMTTSIEVRGSLSDVQDFVSDYCSSNYTNRISVVSCRPIGRYAWLTRVIDDQQFLTWFDTSGEEELYNQQQASLQNQVAETNEAWAEFQAQNNAPIEITPTRTVPMYDPDIGEFIDAITGEVLSDEAAVQIPISLDILFATRPMKVYLVIDFLGRS